MLTPERQQEISSLVHEFQSNIKASIPRMDDPRLLAMAEKRGISPEELEAWETLGVARLLEAISKNED